MEDLTPLADYPNLDWFKSKYPGMFSWGFELFGKKGRMLVDPIEVDLYRLAVAVDTAKGSDMTPEERRTELRKLVRDIYYNGEVGGNKILNAYLLTIVGTFEGAKMLIKENSRQEVGIVLSIDVDSDERTYVAILYKDTFDDLYYKARKGKTFVEIVGEIPGGRG